MKRRSVERAELQADVDVGAAGDRRQRGLVAQHGAARAFSERGRCSDSVLTGVGTLLPFGGSDDPPHAASGGL